MNMRNFYQLVFNMRNLKLLPFVLLLISLASFGQTIRTINVETAGTLSTLISDGEKYTIDELTLTGELNGSDLRLVREMVGCDYLGCQTSGKVTKLDLSGVRIVAGGEKYLDTKNIYDSGGACTSNGSGFVFSSENDVLGSYLFAGCDKLEEIKLPNSIKTIGNNVFHFGDGLTSLTIPKNVTSIGRAVIIYCQNLVSLSVEEGNTVFSSPDGSNAVIKGNTLVMGCNTTVIPNTITTIGNSAFFGIGKWGSKMVLPSNVTTIENDAFACSNFTEVEMPEGLKTIGEYAFAWTPIMNFQIPASVTSIGYRVLYGCQNVESIVVKDNNTNYDSRDNSNAIIDKTSNTVIQGCKNTVIPQSVKTIGNSAFEQLNNLESFTIPSWITSIGDRAFADCWNMKDITSEIEDPSAVTMGRDVFSNYNQDMKRTLYVPSGTKDAYKAISVWKNGFSSIKEIGSNCITLHVNTPGSLSTLISDETKYTIDELILTGQLNGSDLLMIREMAGNGFDGKHIKEARLKVLDLSGVTFVNDTEHAYVSFENDEHIDYPVYGKTDYFRYADGRGTHYVEANKIGKYAFTGCYKLQEIVLPSTITEIDERAFYYCTALSSLMVPASVTNIGSEAIAGCFSLASLTVESGNSTYSSPAASNAIVKGDCLIAGCSTTDFSRLGTISELAPYAFSRQEGMQVIKLPGSIKKIGDYVFLFCSELKDIYSYIETPFNVSQSTFYSINSECCLHVLSGTKSAYLAAEGWKDVFTEDRILEELSSGNAVNVAQAGTLSILLADPMQIEELTVTGNLNGTDFRLIREMAGNDYLGQPTNGVLKKLDISGATIVEGGEMYVDADEVWSSHGSYAHWGGDYFHFNTQQNVLGNAMFAGCEKLVEIVLPKSITSIGNLAFFDCMNLESLVIPDNVSSIGEDVFVECNKLSGVSVAEGNQTFSAPANCNVLMEGTTLRYAFANSVIPEGTTVIGPNAFKRYSGNADFVVPEGVVSIGNNAFAWSNIKSISLPSTLKSIESFAFQLTQLESITIPASVEFIGERILNHCSNLTTIIVASDNPTFDSRDHCNAIIETATNTLIQGCKTTVIPASVTALGTTAFTECYNLTSITIPKSIMQIGDWAFTYCADLKDIYSFIEEPFNVSAYAFSEIGVNTGYTTTLHVPYGTKEAYLKAEGWKEFPNIVEMGGPEAIKISSAKQVTYMSDKDLDFTGYPDLKAYVATGYDKASGTIWLTRVKEVPANTGFLLMGEADTYEIPVKAGGLSSYYQNMFKGTLEATTIYTTDGNYTNYYLSNGESGVGFYKVTKEEGVTLGKNRAYLPIPTEIPVVGTAGSTETIKVSSAGQVPYYNTESLDFSSLDAQGVKAYTATGYDYNSGTIWLTRVKQVPAKTGILIMAPEGEYPVPTVSVSSVYANMFRGTLEGTTIQTHEEIDGKDYINYYLSSGASGVGFYRVTKEEGVTIGANRCYLPILNKDAAAGTRSANSDVNQIIFEEADEVIGIQLLRGIGGDDDGTTSIKEVKSGEVKSDEWFTLQGQRVAKPGKGLYIRNGKVVVIK